MYLCTNCNCVSTQKPQRYWSSNQHQCRCCHNGNFINTDLKNIVISEMIINYDSNMLMNYMPNISTFANVNNINGLQYIMNHSDYGARTDKNYKYRLGNIYNNIEDLKKLSSSEIEALCLRIFGKVSTSYIVPVIVKTNINENYLLVPMSLTSIVEWHKEPNSVFSGVYYEKKIWSLEALNLDDTFTDVVKKLTQGHEYSHSCFSSNNIIF